MIKKLVLALLVTTSVAEAQWLMPARQTGVATNDFQFIPTSKTNAQAVFDWMDDTFGMPYTNTFAYLPNITTNIFGIWPFMTNVDNALAIRWTNNFDRLPDVTTNLFGLWPFLTNVDAALASDSNSIATLSTGKTDLIVFNRPFTNDFNVLPDITTNISGLWPYMTNVDRLLSGISSNSSLDGQPRASFVYSILSTNPVNAGQLITTAMSPISTNLGNEYRRQVITNGMSQVVTGSDNYWVIPSNGFYTLHMSIAHFLFKTGALDTWVTANGTTSSSISNGASRTLIYTYQDNTISDYRWSKKSGSAMFYWPAGTTVRVEAVSSSAVSSNYVNYISVDINRVGGP